MSKTTTFQKKRLFGCKVVAKVVAILSLVNKDFNQKNNQNNYFFYFRELI